MKNLFFSQLDFQTEGTARFPKENTFLQLGAHQVQALLPAVRKEITFAIAKEQWNSLQKCNTEKQKNNVDSLWFKKENTFSK